MKTLNLKSATTLALITIINISILASGLEFRLKINLTPDKIDINELQDYSPIVISNKHTEIGSFKDYLDVMKVLNKMEEIGYDNTEITAYFNYSQITIDDAFEILDNRNEQDQQANSSGYMSEEDMMKALANVQNEDFYYTVQIAISNESNVNAFFDFPRSIEETITAKGYYRYTFGKFYTYNDAKDALQMMKENNFDSAEIIAFDNLDRIPLASAIDKEERRLQASLALVNQ